MVDCVERLRRSGACAVPFVDAEVMPPFDGRPNGIFVWFICETEALKRQFREETLSIATERLRYLASEAGFSRSSADSLQTDVTSSEEIEAGGGRFYFFR